MQLMDCLGKYVMYIHLSAVIGLAKNVHETKYAKMTLLIPFILHLNQKSTNTPKNHKVKDH